MKVLVACEFSGIVREAFTKRGHDAWSCDILPTEKKGKHIQDDVLKHLDEGWDLMIAHPPCTHLAVSGAKWFKDKKKEQRKAIWFFMELMYAPIPKIAVENPVSIMSTVYRKPDQIIQPWQFGHKEFKTTCLWLKNLPKLAPTNILERPAKGTEERKTWERIWRMPPKGWSGNSNRMIERSRTYQGIADAMANQWNSVI